MASQSNVVEKYNNISSQAIQKKVKNSVSTALKRYKIDSYILLDFDKVLYDVYCSVRPVFADYDTRKELVRNLNAMAKDIYGNSKESCPVLEAYGSFVTNTFSWQSDLDLSINFGSITSELTRDMKLQILARFATKLHSLEGQGIVRNVESIFTAMVPIVKFSDQRTAIECDLSVENKNGMLNSQIIRIISQIDGRFQKLCILVKHWAKAHKVNSALHRTLNSVSITLLVALHLQTQDPSILPPFSILFKDGIDPTNVEKTTQNFLNWGQRNQESVGTLFATFFIKLQSVEFLWRQGLCVSVLKGLWIFKNCNNIVDESIMVEDFIDVSKNVARRVNGEGAKKIYSSINRTVDDIFEFLNGKVTGTHLIHSLFGQQAIVEPPLPEPPLNVNIAGNDLRDWLSRQKAVVELPAPVLPLNGNIAGTHLRHRLYGQPPVFRPPVPPLIVYTQQPHNNYKNMFSGHLHNKRFCFGNDYRDVEGSGHGREDFSGKQNRYVGNSNGFEEYRGILQFGIPNNPLDDPYRDVPLNGGANGRVSCEERMHVGQWQDYSGIIGPPPPQPQPRPPYGRVSYNNFGPQNIPRPYFGRSFY